MASFDPCEKESGDNSAEITKYSIKRLELSIKKFVKVLDIDLDRLFKHTANISRLTNAEDWNGLHKEQVNATRTIQQIKANIREIEKARNQVKNEDLPEFDAKVQEVKSKAVFAMEEFMNFIGFEQKLSPQNTQPDSSGGISIGPGKADAPHAVNHLSSHSQQRDYFLTSEEQSGFMYDSFDSGSYQSPYGSLPNSLAIIPAPLLTTSLHVVPQNSQASASWEQLQENIVELNELVHEFATNVEQQGEVISNIEDNIESAHENVREGTHHLAKAAKYKSVLFPVVGAVVGGIVAGPIGLFAGVKIGGLAGAVGTAVGFAGGRFMKKHQQKISDLELRNLSDKRSLSLPDLPDNTRAESRNDI
ncbi:unnamed protein product [Candidula unifasciata]|uniref:t-SNARE coiled-coil homology domain-containing protein n=1 Tax=Candidula unifasciata TaxID=100452 RepID=A0A8S3YPM9_9EUPU|nr:unnamed protein product [Candidula unifasciata]